MKTGKTRTMSFTGFTDADEKAIYDGDILSELIEVDGEMTQSRCQVFWCAKTDSWRLDHSFHQNKSSSALLSKELRDYEYRITGNIYKTNR